jgi:hypothetical protein
MSETTVKTGHPKGLYFLFFTEMWERFSYYGMRAIFILFMTKILLMKDADASQIYGSYTGLVYLTPLLGGYLCDKYLGNRRSIVIGGFTSTGYVRIRDEYMQEVNTAIIKAFGQKMLSILQQSSEGYKKLRTIVLKIQDEPQNITLKQFIEMVKADYPEKYNKISRKLYKDEILRIVEYIEFYEDEIVKDFTRIIYSTGKGKGKTERRGVENSNGVSNYRRKGRQFFFSKRKAIRN